MIAFLINRARRHWQVISTVLLGVLVSTALIASGPLIVNTVMDFALPHKLRSSLAENGTIFITNYGNFSHEEYKLIDQDIKETIHANVDNLSELINTSSTFWVYPWQEESLVDDEGINFRSYGGIENHISFISGSWPEKEWVEPNIVQAVIF